jgi:RND superfamily putative drug exporter
MKRYGSLLVRRRKLALVAFVALIGVSAIWGLQVFGLLKAGGYDNPYSDSTKVTKLLESEFGSQVPEIVLIADMPGYVDTAANAAIGSDLTTDLKKIDGVKSVSSYYTLGHTPSLRSTDGKAAYFFVKLKDGVTQSAIGKVVADKFTGDYKSAKIYVAGFAAISSDINGQISEDLTFAESIAIPLTVVLMFFVFGSLVSAGLPVLVAALSILGSFGAVWLYAQFNDTSVFSVNLITGMGLGLGIDYALLIVNRFREERARGESVHDSVINTIGSAGRTVLFSGLTVAIVLASMAFFPQYFLRSFALGGVVVVMLAVAAALVPLPAILAIIGDGVNKLHLARKATKPMESGIWAATARFVMKRPLAITLVTLLGLGGLMSLMSNVEFGQVDDRILPQSNRSVIANNVIRERFSGREGSPVEIIVQGATDQQVIDYTTELSKQSHIVRAQSVAGIAQKGQLDRGYAAMFASYSKGDYQRIQAISDVEPRSTDGLKLTDDIRKLQISGAKILVGGSAAIYTDSQRGIEHQLPEVLLWIIIWTLVLMFLFTGSVILPIKAVLLNLASLLATIGFLTWVFIGGNLKWLIGDFYVTGTIDTSSLVLVLVVAFGLSMDYELFLLSRIKEQHDAGLGTTESVAIGLQRSGRIITAAALVLAVSFLAFVTSGVSIMKMLGLGIAFAILLDATVIRALLVPALMRLFGELNWWAPKWLKWVHHKVGLDH